MLRESTGRPPSDGNYLKRQEKVQQEVIVNFFRHQTSPRNNSNKRIFLT